MRCVRRSAIPEPLVGTSKFSCDSSSQLASVCPFMSAPIATSGRGCGKSWVAREKNRATGAGAGPSGRPIMGNEHAPSPQPAVKPTAPPLFNDKEEEGAEHDDGPTDAVFKNVAGQLPRDKGKYQPVPQGELPAGGEARKKQTGEARSSSYKAVEATLKRSARQLLKAAATVGKTVDDYKNRGKQAGNKPAGQVGKKAAGKEDDKQSGDGDGKTQPQPYDPRGTSYLMGEVDDLVKDSFAEAVSRNSRRFTPGINITRAHWWPQAS